MSATASSGSNSTIALLYPGEMGAAIGACLAGRGHRLVSALRGRSGETLARAAAAGIEDLGSLEAALDASEIVISVCPPHGAKDLAAEVAARKFRGIFVDGNAVSPDSTRAIGRIVEAGGARFVDGGIVGPPPGRGVRVWLYVCGANAREIAALCVDTDVVGVALDGPLGSASALKMCFAAWSKGSTALLGAIRTLARAEGVESALLDEWAHSAPDVPKRSEAIVANARKAWRYVGEMKEIAASFTDVGLPAGFHLAAAEIFHRLEGFKDAKTPPELSDVTAALGRK